MRNYISELNTKTREKLRTEILSEACCRDSRVDNVHFYENDSIGEVYEIYFHNRDDSGSGRTIYI